jgi:hypothetical protein
MLWTSCTVPWALGTGAEAGEAAARRAANLWLLLRRPGRCNGGSQHDGHCRTRLTAALGGAGENLHSHPPLIVYTHIGLLPVSARRNGGYSSFIKRKMRAGPSLPDHRLLGRWRPAESP